MAIYRRIRNRLAKPIIHSDEHMVETATTWRVYSPEQSGDGWAFETVSVFVKPCPDPTPRSDEDVWS